MNLKKWLNDGSIKQHKTTAKEIENLFRLIDRDISDANIIQLSVDRRFATAYNAALQLATLTLFASGYRPKAKVGHHRITFQVLPELLGKNEESRANYFNLCRAQRNITDYDHAGAISDDDLQELLAELASFRRDIEKWLNENHPVLMAGI